MASTIAQLALPDRNFRSFAHGAGANAVRLTSEQGRVYGTLPAAYNEETITEHTVLTKVTVSAPNANKLVTVDLLSFGDPAGAGTAIQDGTNQICAAEFYVMPNDFTPATGSNSGISVRFYRENTADGNAPTTTAVGGCLIEASTVDTPYRPSWGTTKLKLAAPAGTYQVMVKVYYYTPS